MLSGKQNNPGLHCSLLVHRGVIESIKIDDSRRILIQTAPIAASWMAKLVIPQQEEEDDDDDGDGDVCIRVSVARTVANDAKSTGKFDGLVSMGSARPQRKETSGG
mmetsp:Transcript_18578/g.46072  ORF Transcript_18578/g.46072 Transcript_18578/m.46072 type:complete len:106 (-) Transcript_18578:242-559(-)